MARTLEVKIVGDASQYQRTLKNATTHTDRFSLSLKNLAKVAGLAFGLHEVARGLEDVVSKAMQSQVSMAKLNAAFKSSGVSIKAYAAEVDKAQAAGRKLGFTNIDTQAGLAKLVVATQSGKLAIKDLATAEDLARFKHIDLAAASQMLSQAMTGSARAVKQLGINVVPVQTNLLALTAAHKAAGDKATEQEIATAKLADKQATGAKIIEIVTQRLHGQADAYSKTTAGAMARFKAALEDIEERIGQKLLPIMTKWVNYLTDHLPQIEKFVKDVAAKIGELWAVVNKVVGATVGWKNAILGLLGLAFATKIGGWVIAIEKLIGAAGAGGLAGATSKAGALYRALKLLTTMKVIQIAIAIEILHQFGVNIQDTVTKDVASKVGKYTFPAGSAGDAIVKALASTHGNLTKALDKLSDRYATLNDLLADMRRLHIKLSDFAGAPGAKGSSIYGPAFAPPKIPGGGGRLPSRSAPAASSQEQQLLNFAKMLMGTPYVWGQMSRAGVDCSGLVAWAYGKMGINLPHSTYAQVGMGSFVTGGKGGMTAAQRKRLRPGDVIFTQYGEGGQSGPGHEALYVGGGMVEVARHHGTRVQYQSLSDMIGSGAYSARRYLGDVAPGAGFDPSVLFSGGAGGTRGAGKTRATSPFGAIGSQLASDITGATTRVSAELLKMKQMILAREAALKAALAKAKSDLASALSGLASNALSVVDALGPAFGTKKTRELGAKLTAEQKAIADAQVAAQRAANDKAIADAQATYDADAKNGADAATLAQDKAAIDAAVKARADYEAQAQADADAKALSEQQKRDRDNFEKELAALEGEISKHPERAQKIKAEITKLFAKYGITSQSVMAATDWNTAQTLFVSGMGALKESMDALTAALGGKVPGGGGSGGPPTSGGLGDRGTNSPPTSGGVGGGSFVDPDDPRKRIRRASGGFLPGTDGRGIPIMAHGNEFVLRSSATRKIGLGVLNYMNRTGRLPGYDDGGVVHPWQLDDSYIDPGYLGILQDREARAKAKYGGKSIFNPRNWTPDIVNTAQKYADMLTARFGSDIHFENGWIPEVYEAVRKSAGLIESALTPPPDNIWNRTHGTVWYDLGQGRGRKPDIPSRRGYIPSFATGGVMPHTGLAYVHKGETITPSGRGGQVRDIHVYVGRKEVGAIIQDELIEMGRRGGAYPARPT